MSAHIDDHLFDLAVGTLSADLAVQVRAHLDGCGRCRAEERAITESFGAQGLAAPRMAAPPELRVRVLASTQKGRFATFRDKVSALTQLSPDESADLLDRIDGLDGWEVGPGDQGIAFMHLPVSPSLGDALVGFVRVPAGAIFPRHRHMGDEVVLILQGRARDDVTGVVSRRGDVVRMGKHTEHSFTALAGPPLVYLVVLDGGVEFPDFPGFQV
jgi:putative transcriptional regulator